MNRLLPFPDARCALYAHAVVPSDRALPPLPALPAAGLPVVIAVGAVGAVVSPVPLHAFSDPRAADPEWLAACNAAHQAVAASLPEPALPLAKGALFSGLEAVSAWLRARSVALVAGLERVADAAEWTFSLEAIDPSRPSVPETRRSPGWAGGNVALCVGLTLPAGRPPAAAHREAASCRLVAILDRHARTVRGAAPDWTALVGHRERPALEAALAKLSDDLLRAGLVLTTAGPWPAYVTAGEFAEDTLPAWS